MTAQGIVNENGEEEKVKLEVEPMVEEVLPKEVPVEPPLYIKIKEVSLQINK